MPVGAIVGGVSSLVGDVIGSNAAGKAATAQAQGAQQAQQLEAQNATQAIGAQKTAGTEAQANLSPYQQAGTQALSNLSGMQPFQAPTAEQAQATPGYQFQLQQGLKALQNSAAARGGLLTGGTSKAINDYAQGQAASNYGNTYNRALQSYQTNAGTQFQLAGMGQNAATNLSGLQQQNANQQGGILQNSAVEQAQQINNAAAARASGYAAQGNIAGNAVSGLGGVASSYIPQTMSLSSLFGGSSQQPQVYDASQLNYGGQ